MKLLIVALLLNIGATKIVFKFTLDINGYPTEVTITDHTVYGYSIDFECPVTIPHLESISPDHYELLEDIFYLQVTTTPRRLNSLVNRVRKDHPESIVIDDLVLSSPRIEIR